MSRDYCLSMRNPTLVRRWIRSDDGFGMGVPQMDAWKESGVSAQDLAPYAELLGPRGLEAAEGRMTAATACRTCGTELREGARFCDGCGAPVTAHDTHAEYKQVTVLFADVVGSMDLAAELELERYREIMTDLVERSAAVVQRYGGGTVESTGDGVMAIFGAPIALEDHAFRGCLAALAIQQEANRLADEVAGSDGVDLRLRVCLN